jgi:GNAT superfamily N-acetyltransferase
MSDVDHSELRSLMGSSLAGLGGVVNEFHPGWWAFFTGVRSADVNMALIHENDEATLARVLDVIGIEDLPVLLMLAGDGTALEQKLPDGWQGVGSMPVMTVEVGAGSGSPDPRARPARTDERDEVNQLIVDAYGMGVEEADTLTRPILERTGHALRLWVLEADGVLVSTVITGRVGDSVSVWSMATPPAYARRGYGRALLDAVIDWAASDGATFGLLGATEAGYPLYENTGWHTFERWQLYLNASSVQFSH